MVYSSSTSIACRGCLRSFLGVSGSGSEIWDVHHTIIWSDLNRGFTKLGVKTSTTHMNLRLNFDPYTSQTVFRLNFSRLRLDHLHFLPKFFTPGEEGGRQDTWSWWLQAKAQMSLRPLLMTRTTADCSTHEFNEYNMAIEYSEPDSMRYG